MRTGYLYNVSYTSFTPAGLRCIQRTRSAIDDVVSNGFRLTVVRIRTLAGSALPAAKEYATESLLLNRPTISLLPSITTSKLSATSAREAMTVSGLRFTSTVVIGALPCWNGPHPFEEYTQLSAAGSAITLGTFTRDSVSSTVPVSAHVRVRTNPVMV